MMSLSYSNLQPDNNIVSVFEGVNSESFQVHIAFLTPILASLLLLLLHLQEQIADVNAPGHVQSSLSSRGKAWKEDSVSRSMLQNRTEDRFVKITHFNTLSIV